MAMPKSWRYSANGSRNAHCRRRRGIRPAWHEAMDRRYEIERRIASCSLRASRACGENVHSAPFRVFRLVPLPGPNQVRGFVQGERPRLERPLLASILRDAAALVPEIGECAAAVVHEDAALIAAEMGIGWCRDRLARARRPAVAENTGCAGPTKIQAKLEALLDRIERTEARTPRGEAIKARHAGRVS